MVKTDATEPCKTQTSDKPAIVKLEKKPTPTKEKTTSFNYANIFGNPNKKVPSKQSSSEDIILKVDKGEKLSDNEDKLFNRNRQVKVVRFGERC